jgi:DNA helicase-2/ATP-dependent DNA helicase PcrA
MGERRFYPKALKQGDMALLDVGGFVGGYRAHLLPHHRSANVEEERRVLYVAMTRARAFVAMSYVRQRFSRSQGPSPFLFEIVDRLPPKQADIVWAGRPPTPAHLDQ